MKLSKDQIRAAREIVEPHLSSTDSQASTLAGTVFNLCDTIQALYAERDTLAKQYESQGQPAVARDIRGLGE